jgi:hypothetical protein
VIKRRHRLVPSVETIEARTLLSGGMAGSAVSTAVATPLINRAIALNGTFHGNYHTNGSIPDVGLTFDATGSGRVRDVGRSSITATIHTTGFILQGHAAGTLTLSAARGTMMLELTGPSQGGFAGLPDTFVYSIVSGTGEYRHGHGRGTAILVTKPAGSEQNGIALESGSFSLVLTSKRGATTM